MFTVLDAILAVLFTACAAVGILKGFFAVVSKPVKFVAAIGITFVIASPIINAWTGPFFTNLFYDGIYEYLITSMGEVSSSDAISSLPVVLKIFAAIAGLEFAPGADVSSEQIFATLSDGIAGAIGGLVASVATYIGLYFIMSILLTVLLSVLNKVFSKGVLGVLNKVLGFILGGSLGVVMCCIIASIVHAVSPEFVGGFVYDFFINFNPLAFVLSF